MYDTVIVTGASQGIGREIVKALDKEGVKKFILIARSEDLLNELAKEVKAEAVVVPLDLTDLKLSAMTYSRIWREHGPIDCLVNCAGIANQGSFFSLKPRKILNELNLNVLATYTSTRIIGRKMAARRNGTIVVVSSMMGYLAAPSMSTYSATKSALLGFADSLRLELRQQNIKVVSLIPGLTDTPMSRSLNRFKLIREVSPMVVSKKLIKGLKSGKNDIYVGIIDRVSIIGLALAKPLIQKLIEVCQP